MAHSSSASELKRRLEHARRRQREVEQGRVHDESGVRPLVRQVPAPPPSPVTQEVPPKRLPWRGAALLITGALLGGWVMHGLGPVAFVDVRPAPVATTRPTAVPAPAPDRPADVDVGSTIAVHSAPDGAEIVFRGAVIANTPARLRRPAYPALYLIRRSGYHPRLVRVSPQSGDVVVELTPLNEALSGPAPAAQAPRTNSKPGRARGNDVGRQPAPGRSDGPVVGSSAR